MVLLSAAALASVPVLILLFIIFGVPSLAISSLILKHGIWIILIVGIILGLYLIKILRK